jgi:magnesium transporter
VETQTQTEMHDHPGEHSNHVYSPPNEREYKKLREAVEDCLEIPDAPLPSSLLELRIPELTVVVNQLRLSEAAELVGRVPLEVSRALCDFRDLSRRPRICEQLPPERASAILEGLSSDERARILREMSAHDRYRLLPLVSSKVREEVDQLLRYQDGTAGGIMTTEFVSLRPEITVQEALDHIRAVAPDRESIYACYVLEPDTGHLLGAVSLRDLVIADPTRPVSAIMRRRPITVNAQDRQQEVAEKVSHYNLLAVPVIEQDGRVVGFVTVDDVIDALVEQETDRALRSGGVEAGALDEPYMTTSLVTLVRKRASWLVLLFLGEMLTATAMGYFEKEIANAVVLALFVPLIISSGGNSGSQASTLVIRALALGELGSSDWWRVAGREIISGLALGAILATVGFMRIALWSAFSDMYGPHWMLVGATVSLSLVGVVLWGTLSGSLLPLIIRWLGGDPATSSAPFVATLVDVTGLVIYFSVAIFLMRGRLL